MANKNVAVAVVVVACLVSIGAYADDTKIRILAVKTSDATTTNIQTHLNSLVNAWGNSNISTLIALELVDGGAPSLLSGGALLAPDSYGQIAEAKLPSRNLLTLRAAKNADIVILYTRSFTAPSESTLCGRAPQPYWISTANPGPSKFLPNPIYDMRGASDYFIAIVGTFSSGCFFSQLTAHEFGHLLGGGHQRFSVTPNGTINSSGIYLEADSHGVVVPSAPLPNGFEPPPQKTIMVQSNVEVQECIDHPTHTCVRLSVFSSSAGTGDANNQNAVALAKTAPSVANYLQTPCGLSVPHDVTGHVNLYCIPYSNLS